MKEKIDEQCCATAHYGQRWDHGHQCVRRAVVERDGKLYCKQHDPVEVEKRDKKREENWKKDARNSVRRMVKRSFTAVRDYMAENNLTTLTVPEINGIIDKIESEMEG